MCSITGYNESFLVNREINFLIPKLISTIHDKVIDRYLSVDHNKNLNTIMNRVWLKKIDNSIVPVKVTIQTCVSEKLGLIMAVYFDPHSEIKIGNINSSMDKIDILLTDDNGNIINMTKNMEIKYF